MTLRRLTTPAAIALAITMATVPALAQSGRNEGQRRSHDRGATATRSGNQSGDAGRGAAVRRGAPREDAGRGNSAAQRNAPSDNRSYDARQNNSRPSDNRGYSPRSNDNRSYDARQNNRPSDNRGYNPRPNDNRSYDARQNNRPSDNRGFSPRSNDNRGYDARRDTSRQYSNRDSGYRGSYDRNAWRSRIRFGLGLSIFSGRPFSFRFDYGWRPGFDYRYQVRAGIAYGGMSFLLNPDYAEVYVDGNYVGVARDFGGQPVPVAVGYHRIELYAEGFEPVAFDVNVYPGQVIPYRGSLVRAY